MVERVAVVTGGTRGLGRAIALRLARDDFTPALIYRGDAAAAEEALAELRAVCPRARLYQTDIGDRTSVGSAFERIGAELGPVAALINNAYRAGRAPRKIHEIDPTEFAEDITTNLVGQFLVTRAALPGMIAARFGRVVFIGSIAMRGERGRAAYAAAKSGLVGFAKTLALEYARDGITSNIVNPGFIEAGAFQRFPEEIRERAVGLVPSKRPGRAEEVAAAVAYLCSDDAGYTTGQVLTIDGGTTM